MAWSIDVARDHSLDVAGMDGLSEDDLQSGDVVAFPYDDGRPFIHIAGWASMELTKNLSEMCQLRRLAKDLAFR